MTANDIEERGCLLSGVPVLDFGSCVFPVTKQEHETSCVSADNVNVVSF